MDATKRNDPALLRDLLMVAQRMDWRLEVGNQLARELMREVENNKYGDVQGFWVQCEDAIKRMTSVDDGISCEECCDGPWRCSCSCHRAA